MVQIFVKPRLSYSFELNLIKDCPSVPTGFSQKQEG